MKRIAKNDLACMLLCLPPVVSCCCVACRSTNFEVLFNGTNANEAEAASGAHKMYLTQDSVVLERSPYASKVVKNFTTIDQYGHKYLGAALTRERVVAAEVHVPMRYAEVEWVGLSEFASSDFDTFNRLACGDCGACNTPQGQVVAVKAVLGDVKITLGCVDVGPDGGAELFKLAFDKKKKELPPPTEEEAAAYERWFLAKLDLSGRMAGCGDVTALNPPPYTKVTRGVFHRTPQNIRHRQPRKHTPLNDARRSNLHPTNHTVDGRRSPVQTR